jgi:hypothetical protein
MIYRTRGEHANHYATDAVPKVKRQNDKQWSAKATEKPGWTEQYTRGNRGELSTIREATVVLLLMKWTPSDMEMALDSRIPEWIKKVELWCSWKSLHCSSSCNSRIALVKNTMARLEGEREDWIVITTNKTYCWSSVTFRPLFPNMSSESLVCYLTFRW